MSQPTPAGQIKSELRAELTARWAALWPEGGQPDRPPLFAGYNRAAQRLRGLPEYQRARVIAIMPDPVLLQIRINALQDGKTLLAFTPGLKQGLVRVTPQGLPLPRRAVELRGHALLKAGQPLRLPQAKLGRVDLLVGPCLAVAQDGLTLGDGRGLLDLAWTLLRLLGSMTADAPVAVLAAEEMLLPDLPREAWDVPASLLVMPQATLRPPPPVRPAPSLEGLQERLASLPLVQAVAGMKSGNQRGRREDREN